MTKVEIILYDSEEMFGFAQFHQAVLARRANLAAALKQTPVPQQTSVPNEIVVDAIVDAPTVSGGGRTTGIEPKDIFNAYLNTKGFKAARAKLDAFAVKTFKEITPEQMPAFLASLSS